MDFPSITKPKKRYIIEVIMLDVIRTSLTHISGNHVMIYIDKIYKEDMIVISPYDRLEFRGHNRYGTFILKEIPENLFRNISGPAMDGMFVNTFYNAGLAISGPSAKIGGRYLYEIWPDATAAQVGGCYGGGYSPPTGLTDYADIPAVWK